MKTFRYSFKNSPGSFQKSLQFFLQKFLQKFLWKSFPSRYCQKFPRNNSEIFFMNFCRNFPSDSFRNFFWKLLHKSNKYFFLNILHSLLHKFFMCFLETFSWIQAVIPPRILWNNRLQIPPTSPQDICWGISLAISLENHSENPGFFYVSKIPI